MTDLVNRLFARIFYNKVGQDQFGNDYFISKFKNAYGRKPRIVIYKGMAEPTKIPPLWHAWMHYTTDQLPLIEDKYDWQKGHLPNRTGTSLAYIPPDVEERVEPSRGLYKAWHPK